MNIFQVICVWNWLVPHMSVLRIHSSKRREAFRLTVAKLKWLLWNRTAGKRQLCVYKGNLIGDFCAVWPSMERRGLGEAAGCHGYSADTLLLTHIRGRKNMILVVLHWCTNKHKNWSLMQTYHLICGTIFFLSPWSHVAALYSLV